MTRYRINPGEFRHTIRIQKRLPIQNEYGEESEEWIDVVNTKAGIYPISGREFFAAERVSSEVTHKVNMRYIRNTEIVPSMRILFGNRIFEIMSVINFQEQNILYQLLCKELM